MNKQPDRLKPVIWGAFVMTSISILPVINFINIFFCSGVILGGLAGVFMFNKQISGTDVKILQKDGAMIGVLSGILSAILVSGINLLIVLFSKNNPVIEAMNLMKDISLPKEVLDQMDKFSSEINKYGFSPTIAIFSLLSNLFLYPVFGLLGGILGVTIINKKTAKQN